MRKSEPIQYSERDLRRRLKYLISSWVRVLKTDKIEMRRSKGEAKSFYFGASSTMDCCIEALERELNSHPLYRGAPAQAGVPSLDGNRP